jgi:cell fate (sporulation/competence/biofilm development) regulator YlbF (YheA/YmcA/DUF963 family)
MNCCSTGCQPAEPIEAPEVIAAAERLACLLAGRPELQDFLHQDRLVRQDPEVIQILSEINERAYLYNPNATYAAEEARLLEERLEAQPAVIAYRRAEQSARSLFQAVDRVISAEAGIAFAELAKPSGHG